MKLNHKVVGQGEPLIILHGLMGMLDNWQAVARKLERDFTVITVDLRNHGHSPHSDELSYEVMVEDVIDLLDRLGLAQVHLLGHSMGGKVAMKLAQLYPERVKKLIVVDIGPKYYPPHHQKVLAALRAVQLDKLERRTDAESYMEPFLSDAGTRQFLMKSLYYRERNRFGWRFNLDAIERNIEHVGEATDEADYEGETLFIRGERSDYITDRDWPDIRMVFKNAGLVTIPGAGHWVHADRPDAFVDTVSDFLRGTLE